MRTLRRKSRTFCRTRWFAMELPAPIDRLEKCTLNVAHPIQEIDMAETAMPATPLEPAAPSPADNQHGPERPFGNRLAPQRPAQGRQPLFRR
jgi:hypothetical protein